MPLIVTLVNLASSSHRHLVAQLKHIHLFALQAAHVLQVTNASLESASRIAVEVLVVVLEEKSVSVDCALGCVAMIAIVSQVKSALAKGAKRAVIVQVIAE